VVLVGTLSFIVSILPWYLVGRFIRRWSIQKLPRRYQKWLSLTPEQLEQSSQWFQKKGRAALLISFLLPGMRNLVWIPAGISGMRVPVVLLNAGVGSFIYRLVMTSAGLLLGNQYYLVKQYFASVYHLVFLVLTIALVIEGIKSYVRRRRSRRKQQALR
jgi:membrane protein DedA with SNARE-associated domain